MARISSEYGPRNLFGRTFHHGVDYAASIGSPVYINKDLTITKAAYLRGYGNVIYARDDAGVEYRFGHLDHIPKDIKVGQRVSAGTQIAITGNTGDSTGPHLHYEVRKNGVSVDPLIAKDMDSNSPVLGKTYEHVASFSPNGSALSNTQPTKDIATKPGASSGTSIINKGGEKVAGDTGSTTSSTAASTDSAVTNERYSRNIPARTEYQLNPLLKLGGDNR